MSETATVLVAAFGGGLAGAILQPVASYFLELARSGKEIRKRRERSLRRMLEGRIADGRCLLADEFTLEARGFASILLTGDERAREIGFGTRPLWQPERISDPGLQQMARAYNEACSDLEILVRFAPPDAGGAKKAAALAGVLEDLQPRITRRMDELNWPEGEA